MFQTGLIQVTTLAIPNADSLLRVLSCTEPVEQLCLGKVWIPGYHDDHLAII